MTIRLLMAVVLMLGSAYSLQAQTYQVIYNFTGGQDGAYPQAGLTEQGENLYGTAYQGGASNRGTVFMLAHKASGWAFSQLYSFTGQADGSAPIARVVVRGPVLYGTTEFGGQNCGFGCGVVFTLTPPTGVCTRVLCPWTESVLYRFHGSGDGANPGYGDLTFDQAGNIYGTTYFGGSHAQGVVYELSRSGSGWIERAIHAFSGVSDGENPYGSVIFDAAGNLYGTTYAGGAHGYGTVFELSPPGSGWTEKTLYSFQDSPDGGQPFGGVLFDSTGNLYGATSSGGSSSGGTAYQLMSPGGSWNLDLLYSFSGSAHLPGSYASLTMDSAGSLYGTTNRDGAHGQGSVFKLTPSGNVWTETDLYDFPGGAQGGVPFGNVLIDANGNLYGTASQGGANGYGVIWEITP